MGTATRTPIGAPVSQVCVRCRRPRALFCKRRICPSQGSFRFKCARCGAGYISDSETLFPIETALPRRERTKRSWRDRKSVANCTYWRDECDASPKRRASLFTGKGSRSPFLEWREGPAQWDDLDRPRRGAARESRSHRALAAARPKGDRAPACGCSDSEVLGREKKCGTRMHLSNFLVETDLPDTLTLVSRVRQRIIRYALSGSERSQATM